jgi:glutamate/tyrosine decarboxylase-like PLP-dependent enzyme
VDHDPLADDPASLLEPADWQAFREEAHRALDVALTYVEQRPEVAVWQEVPQDIKAVDQPLPLQGSPLPEVVEEVRQRVLPYTMGNTHPRFWGWVNGSGTPSAIVSQILTAAINANMGGRDHAPIYIERQVVRWMHQLFGYPQTASGITCTGTSSATLLALAVARQRKVGPVVRARGNPTDGKLVAYCSEQAHVSVSKAIELLGLGSDALRAVPVGADFTMDCAALAQRVGQDLDNGLQPFAVVSSVGSVNTGAIDNLPAVNALCRENGLWHHVDGAFGALVILSDSLRPLLEGIDQADSIAFDFHKWMHVTYSAGCLLVRDGELHRKSFETAHAYLLGQNKGVAGGAPWPNDFGIDLSRGFSALGVWMQLREVGVEKLGQAIERNCQQAAWLGRQVEREPALELLAPVSLNIVCFRYVGADLPGKQLDRLNRHIVLELQCRGIAAPSFTALKGNTAIRVCIANHRTRLADLEALLSAVLEIAPQLLLAGRESEDFDVTRLRTK